ncbi:hypothetical protein FISHEDRAFT_71818 [Fistulina hepatica ATCC 64428]|uniref:Uncharacterized protein n=1 Tax=Fistulina hepatica ATCC 64428 TaxID=1128425 RepID=A0A0D7AIN8_9AGAR|nr:hypothetical protein FISHEDRAFT_71818 [Fistulina hepatica ATCC 64428]
MLGVPLAKVRALDDVPARPIKYAILGAPALRTRSQGPPSSPPNPENGKFPEIPDLEWELRTGRAIYVLQRTLPAFFESGLITSIDKVTGLPRPSTPLTPFINLNDENDVKEDLESIYSRNIRLSYTPPTPLPAPFPKTLHVEGYHLYIASSAFIRHTLNALHSDLRLDLTKFAVNAPESEEDKPDAGQKDTDHPVQSAPKNRSKSLFVAFKVIGQSRVTGNTVEWDVRSTYTFSPLTGLILKHRVHSIQPEPHLSVYEPLRSSLGKVFGFGGNSRQGGAGAACKTEEVACPASDKEGER